MMNMNRIALDNTRFIFMTNFSGDPARDKWGDDRRKANIIIPSEEQAKDMTKAGINVRVTKPREHDDPATFKPEYFVQIQTKYRKRNREEVKYPPNVYLVTGDNDPVLLTEDTIGCLDKIRVKNVNCIVNPRENDDGNGISLYVRTMYVEQDMDDDPYAALYRRKQAKSDEMDEDDTW